jgi:hypothetical protein
MGVAKGIDKKRTRVGAHRTGMGACANIALNDLALAMWRGRCPPKRQRSRTRFYLGSFRQMDLDCCAADHDTIDQVANFGLRGRTV